MAAFAPFTDEMSIEAIDVSVADAVERPASARVVAFDLVSRLEVSDTVPCVVLAA